MNHQPPPTIRPIARIDEQRWRELFAAYREFYRLAPDERALTTVWEWLMDPGHELRGVAAWREEEIVGIAHYRPFSRPSTGTVGLWLDDLYTDSSARRSGAGAALITHIRNQAKGQGASVVRWITAADNSTAQSLYNRLARKTTWMTYDLTP